MVNSNRIVSFNEVSDFFKTLKALILLSLYKYFSIFVLFYSIDKEKMMNKYIQKLYELDAKLKSIQYFMNLTGVDEATIAPKKSVKGRSVALSELSKIYYDAFINDENKKLFEEIEKITTLTEDETAKFTFIKNEYNKLACIPKEEYAQYTKLETLALKSWEEAKEKDDYSIFSPYLKKIIQFKKKYIKWRGLDGHPYDTLLEDFEPGLTVEKCDTFFNHIKAELVPLIQKISAKSDFITETIFNKEYAVDKQKELSYKLLEVLNYDLDAGLLSESVHPFTTAMTKDDVRITTHYHKNAILSSIYSTIHEAGHALYDQNVSDDIGFSLLATGVSMGIHESQSRFYENNIAHSKVFVDVLCKKLEEVFGKEYSFEPDKCYKEVNISKPSLIRIHADELTYPLHIIIRYEIEKEIFEGKLEVKDLPNAWNDKYEEYLGVRATSDAYGVLQDVHWSFGGFGYFPTYAIGSAFSAQIMAAMQKDTDVNGCIKEENFEPINNWLHEKIHQYGCMKTPEWLMINSTGETLNPTYYTDYLKEKYSALYEL